MKKILIFGTLAVLGLSAVSSFAMRDEYKRASANVGASTVAAALREARDNGCYTKRTKIFLTAEAADDMRTHFHAGVSSLERTTYYDETKGGLLMGDYAGGFSINSGYMNDGEGNCQHFRYKGAADPSTSDLFTNITPDWKAYNQEVGVYYQTIESLASLVETNGSEWETFPSYGYTVYKHSIAEIIEDDPFLHDFQFFAAPMLLTDNYLTFNSIWVIQTKTFLSIRLYADKINAGMSTMTAGDNDVLMSEARVYKGLSFSPDKWVIKGSFDGLDDWNAGAGIQLEYSPDGYNAEQYTVTTDRLDDGVQFKFVNMQTNEWIGHDGVTYENFNGEKTYYYIEDAGGDTHNFKSRIADSNITIWWKPGEQKVYFGVNSGKVTQTFQVTINTGMGYGMFLVGDFSNWKATVSNRMSYSNGNWVIEKEFEIGTTIACKVVKADYDNPGDGDYPGWYPASNVDITFDGGTSLFTNFGSF